MNLSDFNYLAMLSELSTIWVLLAALVLDKYVPIPSSINPLDLFNLLSVRMTTKVLKSTHTPKQQSIAGFSAHLILVLPFVTIVAALYLLAGLPWLLNIILLWLSLQFNSDRHIFLSASSALSQDKLTLARELSQQKLRRETKLLSKMGLSKALVEGLFARYQYQYVSVIFCFLLLGPLAAFAYRLSFTCSQSWNGKHTAFNHFSRFTQISCRTIQCLPSLLSNMLFCLLFSPTSFVKDYANIKTWRQSILCPAEVMRQTLRLIINKNTGGPIFYDNQKISRQRYIALSQLEPEPMDVNKLQNKLNIHLLIIVLFGAVCVYLV
ncbi:cobalamin biosynthesis protein [Glaciecola petra]|uniref:Cobalamin biosynthesis protein n=1 Tax=Glaciecola petra TaxID=3075602 RepID=A0ABU2ZTN9_9ALTE|nr:cobalamin biosynthesis protein [Aestuariibacter sp. P117]MDT0596007.1 cobalamin biosynthesis protein [Aestuariibacter sp. P117]